MDALALLVATALFAAPSRAQEESVHQDRHSRKALPTAAELAALPADGGPEYNRLVFEKSPYLLQHAANPVDWYPWGEEAFAAARAADKPIFLSIGYSTCHWCHVMERESFEDEEVAALMNESFVCVKVDREERPDLDHVYMTVTQAMTGSGGWPMTVVLTPEARPFFAGTYFPKESRYGRRGMLDLIPLIADVWKEKRREVLRDAERITQMLVSASSGAPGDVPGERVLALAQEQLASRFDPAWGGFGNAPKFPTPHNLTFLLRRSLRTGDARPRDMVTTTLERMRAGGIWDHVGFGFHRYSTDRVWLVPHFEKMLYDQALLALAYTAAWQATGDAALRRTAEEIFTYVLRDMTSPEGGFFSAEDADSEGVEGRFYVWTLDEVRAVLAEEDAALFARVYELRPEGNFHDEASGEATGANIPHLERDVGAWARALELEEPELRARLERCRAALFAAREERVHPLKDDKILTDWNGLMIAALARAAGAFDEPRYARAAARAADFALVYLTTGEGRLRKRYRQGEAGLPGTLEDHAFLAWGLLELYEADFDPRWLRAAIRITDEMVAHFADPEDGGFFLSADDGEELIVRAKDVYDGALPSGNSVAALVLMRLGRITAEERYEKLGEGTLRAFAGAVAQGPAAFTQLLEAVDFLVGPTYEVVVAGDPAAADTRALLAELRGRFVPPKVLLLRPNGDEPEIARLAPYTAAQEARGGRATVYVCRDFACDAPRTDAAAALAALRP